MLLDPLAAGWTASSMPAGAVLPAEAKVRVRLHDQGTGVTQNVDEKGKEVELTPDCERCWARPANEDESAARYHRGRESSAGSTPICRWVRSLPAQLRKGVLTPAS